MTASNTIKRPYLLSALIILLSCFALFSIDRETHSIADLFKKGNLVALVIYFAPTYYLCSLIYELFRRRHHSNSFSLSLIIGIPFGFAVVIVVMSYLMGRI